MKSYGMTIQMKPLQQFVHMKPFVFWYFTEKNMEIFPGSFFKLVTFEEWKG